jgi:hypothetical protein
VISFHFEFSAKDACASSYHVARTQQPQAADLRQPLVIAFADFQVRLPSRIEYVNAFTRPAQHCEISQRSIRDWCSEIFWDTSLNLVTEFPYRYLHVLKTFAGKHSVSFRKSENLTESQLRPVFRKVVCIPIKKALRHSPFHDSWSPLGSARGHGCQCRERCKSIKEARREFSRSSALGDFLRVSLNEHMSRDPNHQRPENVAALRLNLPFFVPCRSQITRTKIGSVGR